MASSINASTSAGVVTTADTSGVLNIQTAGTTAISIDASQAVSFTNQPTYSGGTANGVAYLNGSKVLTTGSALAFDGSNLLVGNSSGTGYRLNVKAAFTSGVAGAYIEAGEFNQSVMVLNHTNASVTSNLFQVQKSGTGVLTLDSSGNLLVGSSSTIGTGGKFQVTSSTDTAIFKSTAATTFAAIVSNVENTAARLIAFQYGSGGSPTNVGRITTDGTNIALANVSGITFPATQSASADANTLDDYEEGSCTLVLSDSNGNNATMGSANVFRYIKIGRMVSVSGTLNWTSVTGVTTSRTRITGLPFTASSVNAMRWVVTNGSSSSGSFNITRSEIAFGVDFNNAFLWGTKISGNNLDNNMTISDIGSSGTLYGLSFVYYTEN